MKKTLIFVIALSSLLNASNQNNCIEKPKVEETCCVQFPNHRFQIGPNYTYAWVTPEGNSTPSGSLFGAQALYEYRPMNSFYGALVFDWRMGKTDNNLTKRTIMDIHGQERLGYTFHFPCFDSKLSLFSGLGGRYMSEKVSVGNASVRFNYAHFYVPVGFLANYEFNCFFDWGLGFQWRPQIYPTVQIVPLDGARWMLTKRIDNFYVQMPLTFAVDNYFSFVFNPFFEYWHDGKTYAVTLLGLPLNLPCNRYYFVGLDINFTWDF